ncbi:hypothetical protein O181_079484 [Austropuccinia psidii MF-1]|uniref:Uncharacterized protein n=1 Tax=Austropuccinia psidii MF-1 TaxID=1389203 RepID=A0A9Q3II99_9BASI|nr:hypothetical protein [Austropuccinia psidii MF-1]
MVPNNLQELSSWYEVAVRDGTPRSLNGMKGHLPPGGSQLCGNICVGRLGSIVSPKGKKRPQLASATPVLFDSQRHGFPKKTRADGASELRRKVPNPKPLFPGDDFHQFSFTPDFMGYSGPPEQWKAFHISQELFRHTGSVTDRLKSSEASKLTQSLNSIGPSGIHGLSSEENAIAEILLSLNQGKRSEVRAPEEKQPITRIKSNEKSVSVVEIHKSSTGSVGGKDDWISKYKMGLESKIDQRLKHYQEDLVVAHFLNLNGLSLGQRGNIQTSHKDLLYAFIATLPGGKRVRENRQAKVGHPLNCVIQSSLQNYGGIGSIDPITIATIKDLRDHMLVLNSWTLKVLKPLENFALFQDEERALESAFNHLFSFNQVKRALLTLDAETYEESQMLNLIKKLLGRTREANGNSLSLEFQGRYRTTCVAENEIMRTEISLGFIKSYYQTINPVKWKGIFEDDEGYLCYMVASAHKLGTNHVFRCHNTFKLLKTFLPWGVELTDEQKATVALANKPWLQFSFYLNLPWLKGHLKRQPHVKIFLPPDGP